MSDGDFDKYDTIGAYHWEECDRRYANWKRFNPPLIGRYQLVVDQIARLKPDRLLDIGCGDAKLLSLAGKHAGKATGIDLEETGIRLAKEKLKDYPNCEAIHNTCYELPFDEASFDAAISADVIEHLNDREAHLREIHKILKPGGTLILTTPRSLPGGLQDQRHVHEYQADELRDFAGKIFDRVEMRYYWPQKWINRYNTKIGWRLLKLLGVQLWNPFMSSSESNPEDYTQLMAVCHKAS
tara:strand:- start:64 stop:783 length:720 start_codon:yes stop_codon:yes gene_type:complete